MEILVKEGFSISNWMGTPLSGEAESQSIGEKVLEIFVSVGHL